MRAATTREGVSFVIPVHNGEEWLAAGIRSVLAQVHDGPIEVIVVDDGSTDGSREILARFADSIQLVPGPGRGAAAALNEGIRRARHPIICQVDQDVILESGWTARLVAALADPRIGAAQGYYVTPRNATFWSQVMGLDLELRYSALRGRDVDHVCTGNTAYRAAALRQVGLFDESLGYGYDNDVSYRLHDGGYRLVICPDARSEHRWREGIWQYARQQYGFGYGRLDLVAKHRHRFTGDVVSTLSMMLHAPAMLAACVAGLSAGVIAAAGQSPTVPTFIALILLAILGVERFVAGCVAAVQFRNAAGLLFVPVHAVRDCAWAVAIVVWGARRAAGLATHPTHSMHPRQPVDRVSDRRAT